MKKNILITGANSYIGTNVEKWLKKNNDKYCVETLDMKNLDWIKFDFSKFDVVLHVAGIAHIKENKKNRDKFYEINRDLTIKVAEKAKLEKVSKFIFMSSMSIFGIDRGVINLETQPQPKSAYGKSKFEAEKYLIDMQNTNFSVYIVRPPIVYGKNCKGNYYKLSKFIKKCRLFPKIDNRRSMIYIDNLVSFIEMLINSQVSGIYHPQNSEYVNIVNLLTYIANANRKKIYFTKLFNPLIKALNFKMINKIFGSLYYEMEMSNYNLNYRVVGLKESVYLTEVENEKKN